MTQQQSSLEIVEIFYLKFSNSENNYGMDSSEIPQHIQKEIQGNIVQQKLWGTASFVSAIIYGVGCSENSMPVAGGGLAIMFITGMTALIHRIGNDDILKELERMRGAK